MVLHSGLFQILRGLYLPKFFILIDLVKQNTDLIQRQILWELFQPCNDCRFLHKVIPEACRNCFLFLGFRGIEGKSVFRDASNSKSQ